MFRGEAGGMAGMAVAIPIFGNLSSKVPRSSHSVFTDCPTNISLPATSLTPGVECSDLELLNDTCISASLSAPESGGRLQIYIVTSRISARFKRTF